MLIATHFHILHAKLYIQGGNKSAPNYFLPVINTKSRSLAIYSDLKKLTCLFIASVICGRDVSRHFQQPAIFFSYSYKCKKNKKNNSEKLLQKWSAPGWVLHIVFADGLIAVKTIKIGFVSKAQRVSDSH